MRRFDEAHFLAGLELNHLHVDVNKAHKMLDVCVAQFNGGWEILANEEEVAGSMLARTDPKRDKTVGLDGSVFGGAERDGGPAHREPLPALAQRCSVDTIGASAGVDDHLVEERLVSLDREAAHRIAVGGDGKDLGLGVDHEGIHRSRLVLLLFFRRGL